ncbi:hypothetical protein Lal_00050046 [Lupinus albus]|nr:hypothetical protein Lal_00050046 [Lupinus albus]
MEENLLQRYWQLHQPSQSFFLDEESDGFDEELDDEDKDEDEDGDEEGKAISGGEVIIGVSYIGVPVYNERIDLCQEVTCPVSNGNL